MEYAALALFDIDGTLIRRAGAHHRDAMVEAIRRVTGLETTMDGVQRHGMLDPDIIREMLLNAGASRALVRQATPAILRRAESIYRAECPETLHRKTCPGVRRLLASLARHGILAGLVTGNLTRIGWRKMELAGLREYFRFGAFGEMASTRAGLVKAAVLRARRERWIGPKAAVTLIGDSTADVLAAKKSRVRSIAVATGIVPADDLRACSPDLLLDDLRKLRPEMLL